MGDFNHCIHLILQEEGGLANHRGDPGGLTKFGISQRAYPDLDLGALSVEQARAIYRRDYWDPINGDILPMGLDLLLLDCAVNQGVPTAIRLWQRAVRVAADGIIGPVTLTATRRAMPQLLDAFAAERALRYECSSGEEIFGRGWYRRLLRIHRAAWKAATEPGA